MLALSVVLFVIILFGIIYLSDRNALDVLPGPSRIALFLMFVKMNPYNLFPTVRMFSRRYGDRFIFRLFDRRRVLHLSRPEDVEERTYEEIIQVLGGSDKSPTLSDLTEMKYLEAVIKETLRLYPSVPFIGRDITEDFMMGDILVKKGTEVSVHIFEMHHRADIYPDPEHFKPERFLSGETRHAYAYIPFSAGPRNCIGQKFAMQELKLIITEVCRNFRLLPKVKGHRPTLKVDLILRPAEPVYVKFIPRNRAHSNL